MIRRFPFLILLCLSGAAAFAGSVDSIPVTAAAGTGVKPVNVPLSYRQQLDSIQQLVPLDYNEYVRHYIELYTYRRRGHISRMMGLSEYYFPIFRSEEHTSELQSLMRISYAVFCLKIQKQTI